MCQSFSRAAQAGGPRDPSAGWWLSLPPLVSTSSDLQLSDLQLNRGSRRPILLGAGFPYHIFLQLLWSPTLTELYNSSVASSIFGMACLLSSSRNNCHAVHRSLSSGASVYEYTMGFLPCPYFSAKPASAISSHNCHRNVSLPSSASLWNSMFGRVEGQYTTVSTKSILAIKKWFKN